MDGAVVEATMTYLRAGVAMNTLKEVYGLTATQVKALETAQKSYEATLKEVQKVEEAKNSASLKALEDINIGQAKANKQAMDDTLHSLTETEKLWVDYYDRVDAATLSATDYKKLKVKEWFDNEVLKLKDDDANWMAHYDALYATAQQRMGEITDQSNHYVQDTKKFLGDLEGGPGGWEDTFAHTLATTHSFKDAAKAVFGELETDVLNIFGDLLSNLLKGFFAPMEAKLGSLLAQVLGVESQASGFVGPTQPGTPWWQVIAGGGGGASGSDPTQPGGGQGIGVGIGLPFHDPYGGGGADPTGSSGQQGSPTDYPAYAKGGIVYAAGGWMRPQGTDTVPAMLTPGERVLTVQDTRTFERAGGLGALRGGQMGPASSGLESRIDALHATIKRQGDQLAALVQMQPQMLRHAMRGA
jgi:hypothetical protein